MKKLLLIFIIIAKSNSVSYSQVLANTTWSVYDTSNAFFVFFQFDGDTLSASGDNINYYDVSTYLENGNNFILADLASSGSSCLDTGRYTFLIQSDNLIFTLVDDPCSTEDRPLVLTAYTWERLFSGISENTSINAKVSVYPNPFSFETTISFNKEQKNTIIKLTDMFGKEIKTVNFSGKQLTLEKGNMSSGIYFLQIGEETKNAIIKKVIIQ